MKRIKAIKNGVVSNQAEFKSVDEANAWLAKMIATNSFGKPERWLVVHKGFDDIEYVEGEDISQAIETRVGVGSLGEEIVEKKFAAEYQVLEEDMTQEIADKDNRIQVLRNKVQAFKDFDIDSATLAQLKPFLKEQRQIIVKLYRLLKEQAEGAE